VRKAVLGMFVALTAVLAVLPLAGADQRRARQSLLPSPGLE